MTYDPSPISNIFRQLGDEDSRRVAETLDQRAVDLHLFSRERFEALKEGISEIYWEGDDKSLAQNGLYLYAGARNPLDSANRILARGAIFVAVPSAELPVWADTEEVLFEALGVTVHEHAHHLDSPFDFSREDLEDRAMRIEGRWRRCHMARKTT